MSVSDLTNTTWKLDRTLVCSIGQFDLGDTYGHTFNLSFTSNNNTYTSLALYRHWYEEEMSDIEYDDETGDEIGGNTWTEEIEENTLYYGLNTQVYYDADSWEDEADDGDGGYESPYQTITITGGTDATNSDLITWLEANATQQTPSQDLKLYFGSSKIEKIAFMENSTEKEVVSTNCDVPKDIETTSWNDIKAICKAGKIKTYWQIGEIKSFNFNGYAYQVRLVDMQEGRYTYVSDGSPTHAVFELVQLYENAGSIDSSSTSVIYKNSMMNNNWLTQALTYTPVKNVLENIYIKCRADDTSTTTEDVSVKLFLPASSELKQTAEYGDYTLYECERESVYDSGKQLDAFDYYKTATNDMRKKGRIQNGNISNYWTRTIYNNSMYNRVNDSGGIRGNSPSSYYYYSFCFAL